MIRNLLLVLGVLLVGSAAWLVDAMSLSPRATVQDRDAQRIDDLLAARLTLELSVLEARAGLQLNFDPLNRALASLREAAPVAEALQQRGSAYASAAEQVALAARALTAEEAALEQFKTDLALLQLSSHYFPLAADVLMRSAEAHVQRHRHSVLSDELTTLAALRTDMERYEELPEPEGRLRLEHGLSQLDSVRAGLGDAAREQLDVLTGHTRAVLDRRERVDRFAHTLVRSPVRMHLEAARAAYERGALSRARRVGALRMLSALLALAGVSVLASVVLRSVRPKLR